MKLNPNDYSMAVADTVKYNTGKNLKGMDIHH
jgi:hypothetical protein